MTEQGPGRGRASGREAGGGDATTRSSDPVEVAPGLPEPMARVLADYERHLVSERDLTPHTVRAYAGDIAAMLEHAARLGHHDVATIDLRALRNVVAAPASTRTSPAARGAPASGQVAADGLLGRGGRVAAEAVQPVSEVEAVVEVAHDGSPS